MKLTILLGLLKKGGINMDDNLYMDNNLYPTRYKATKERDTNPRHNGDDIIVKVTGGYTIMSPWEYDVWRKQK